MKKYKYQRLNKDEKKDAKIKFYQTKQGMFLKKKFNRILVYSIILILFGIYLLIDTFINSKTYNQYIYGAIIIIFGISFLVLRCYIQMRKINEFITKKPKKNGNH